MIDLSARILSLGKGKSEKKIHVYATQGALVLIAGARWRL